MVSGLAFTTLIRSELILIYGAGPVLLFYMWRPVFPAPFPGETILLLYILGSFVEH